jgi:predicted enzyme related to lactoylglutathione lyase
MDSITLQGPELAAVGSVCWVDLAATDVAAAVGFYGALFGWEPRATQAQGGEYLTLAHAGQPFGSMYQLARRSVELGTPSHWLAYVRVEDVDAALARAQALGGETLVAPQDIGPVRIAVLLDPVGAPIGLMQPTARS